MNQRRVQRRFKQLHLNPKDIHGVHSWPWLCILEGYWACVTTKDGRLDHVAAPSSAPSRHPGEWGWCFRHWSDWGWAGDHEGLSWLADRQLLTVTLPLCLCRERQSLDLQGILTSSWGNSLWNFWLWAHYQLSWPFRGVLTPAQDPTQPHSSGCLPTQAELATMSTAWSYIH